MTRLEIKDKYGEHVAYVYIIGSESGVVMRLDKWKTKVKSRSIPYKRGIIQRIRDKIHHPDNMCNEQNWFDGRMMSVMQDLMKIASDMTIKQEMGMARRIRENEIYEVYWNQSMKLYQPYILSDFTRSLM